LQRDRSLTLPVLGGGGEVPGAGGHEFLVGFVVGPLGRRGVAVQRCQALLAAEKELGRDAAIKVVGLDAVFHHAVEYRGLDAADAGEAPAGLGHLFDQERFVLGVRSELATQVREEAIEFTLVFVVEDAESPGESMFGRVPRGGGLALGRFRARGELRVFLIRDYLS